MRAWPTPRPPGASRHDRALLRSRPEKGEDGEEEEEEDEQHGESEDKEGEESEERVVTITAECHQFLYHMVRFLAGTLVEVGLGRLSPQGAAAALAQRGRVPGGPVGLAPARGLCLDRCFYGGPPWAAPASSVAAAANEESEPLL